MEHVLAGCTDRVAATQWARKLKAFFRVALLIPVLWLAHGEAAQAQACTQFSVLNHSTYQAFRTNSATGSCTLPSGIVMSWSHVGANRGLTSFGCSSYDPTYWMDGGTMTVTFSQPVNDVGFIMWGLDGGDSATVVVGNVTTQVAPQTLSNEFTDLCPGFTSGTPPVIVGNVVQSGGGGYFGQIGARAHGSSAFTVLQLNIVGGSGFGLVGVGSPTPIVAAASVTYNGNGNTGGTPPVDANNYPQGATVTVLGNTGGLVRSGFTFAGWNTAANGTGTTYQPGQTFAMPANALTLYALWVAVPVVVSPAVVPTVSEWGLMLLIALLAGAGVVMMRRRAR